MAVGYALQFATVSLEPKVAWSVLWTASTVIASLALLVFALASTGRTDALTGFVSRWLVDPPGLLSR